MKFTSSSKRGLSIVEAIVGLSIITTVGIVAFRSLRESQTQIVRTETSSGFDAALASSLKQLREVVTNVGVNGNQGLCRIMDTRMTTGGVGFISVALPATSADPFLTEWNQVFGDNTSANALLRKGWLPDTENCASTTKSYQRCFKPDPTKQGGRYVSGLTDTLMQMKPRFKFVITPVVTRAGESAGSYSLVSLPNMTQDARDTSLMLTAQVSYENTQKGKATDEQFSLVWLGEYRCKKVVAGKTIVMSPSAIGTGASTEGNTISELFSTTQGPKEDIIQGSFLATAYTEGFVKDGRAITQEGIEYTATGACVEHIYRCGKSTANRQWVESIETNALVRYNPNNGSIFAASITTVPSVRFETANGSNSIAPASTFAVDGTAVTANGAIDLYHSSRALKAETAEKNLVCPRVCTADTGYNDKSATNPYKVVYDFKITSQGNQLAQLKDTQNFGCVCCYGKQCSAIGTKMTSWCAQQPPEPLDSRVPECSAAESANVADQLASDSSPAFERQSFQPNSCLAASLGTDGKIVLESMDCTKPLKYLCYSQGGFKVASTDKVDAVGAFTDAAQRCYDMGWESAIKKEVDERLSAQGNLVADQMPKPENGQYHFLNAALAGIFIAPQTPDQIGSALLAMSKHATPGQSTQPRFWIALRTNDALNIVAALPEMAPKAAAHMTYFDARGSLYFAANTEAFNLRKIHPVAMALHHSAFYFGATGVDEVQGTDALSTLCYSPFKKNFFRTKASVSKAADAGALCRPESGAYYAPQSPMQWTHALLQTKNVDQMLPWPLRNAAKESLNTHSTWIALKRASETDPWIPSHRMGSSTHLMSAWGDEIPADSLKSPTRKLCRESGVLKLRSMNEACTYDKPKNAVEDVALLNQLADTGILNGDTVLLVAEPPTPPPPAGGG